MVQCLPGTPNPYQTRTAKVWKVGGFDDVFLHYDEKVRHLSQAVTVERSLTSETAHRHFLKLDCVSSLNSQSNAPHGGWGKTFTSFYLKHRPGPNFSRRGIWLGKEFRRQWHTRGDNIKKRHEMWAMSGWNGNAAQAATTKEVWIYLKQG